MQVDLGRRGEYSIRVVLDLTRHHGFGRRKAREIASAMDIPSQYVAQILATLVRHGLLVAVAGPDGGYTLARDPTEITLLDVIEIAEGPVITGRCAVSGSVCAGECPMHETWARARQALLNELRATNFAQLAEREAIQK